MININVQLFAAFFYISHDGYGSDSAQKVDPIKEKDISVN